MQLSDQEQKQLIKDWWKQYGNSILIAILVFAVANFGWRYWQQYQNRRLEAASVTYVQMMNAHDSKKDTEVNLFAKHLMQDFASSPYASLAAFMLAKDAVQANNLNLALEQLNWVIAHARDHYLIQIAKIRAARILITLNKAQDAFNLLTKVDAPELLTAVAEARGDALMALGNRDAAAKSYKEALDAANQEAASPLLKLKLEQF